MIIIGEHLQESNSFLIDLIVTFIGAFLGFFLALILNRRSENKQKRTELEKQVNSNKDILRCFNLYIESTYISVEKQLSHYEVYTSSIRTDLYQQQLPVVLATSDFSRLQNFDNRDLFKAYNEIDYSSENRIKDFKNLFNHIDYICKILPSLEARVEKRSTFLHADHTFIHDTIEEIIYHIGISTKHCRRTFPDIYKDLPEYIYLFNFESVYLKLIKEGFPIGKFKEEFIVPLHDTIDANISDQKFVDFLIFKIKAVLYRINNLELNSLKFSDDFLDCKEHIQIAIKFLKAFKLKIDSLTN
jgi:hypothetical protein